MMRDNRCNVLVVAPGFSPFVLLFHRRPCVRGANRDHCQLSGFDKGRVCVAQQLWKKSITQSDCVWTTFAPINYTACMCHSCPVRYAPTVQTRPSQAKTWPPWDSQITLYGWWMDELPSGHFVFPMSFPLAFIVRSRWVSWWINSLFLFLAPFLVKLNLFHHFCTVLCISVAFRVLTGWSELCYLLTFPVFPYLYPVKQRVLSELCEYLSLEGNQKFKLKMLLTVMSWI